MAQIKKEAELWAKQQEKQRQAEEEERIKTAEFWLEYQKKLAKLSENNRPSALTFGLL